MQYHIIYLGSTDDETGQNGFDHLYLGSVKIVEGSVLLSLQKSFYLHIKTWQTVTYH